jgi:transposase, IS30 family
MLAKEYTNQPRAAFFAVMDKGPTVWAVAAAAGVSPDRGYAWIRWAGILSPRGPSRRYSQADKGRIFDRLAEVGNVSRVARELGFVRVTCYKWAHRAGIFTGIRVDDKREEFLRLRHEGRTRAQASGEGVRRGRPHRSGGLRQSAARAGTPRACRTQRLTADVS